MKYTYSYFMQCTAYITLYYLILLVTPRKTDEKHLMSHNLKFEKHTIIFLLATTGILAGLTNTMYPQRSTRPLHILCIQYMLILKISHSYEEMGKPWQGCK